MVGFLLNVTLYQLEPLGLKVTENLVSILTGIIEKPSYVSKDLGSFSLVCFLSASV